jgi:hypothetical protein
VTLFPGLRVLSESFVGTNREVTNMLSALLMDLAGNPWGTYSQEEPCTHCGAVLHTPDSRQTWQRVCSALAVCITRIQSLGARPHANWIHLLLSIE